MKIEGTIKTMMIIDALNNQIKKLEEAKLGLKGFHFSGNFIDTEINFHKDLIKEIEGSN
jgi:hypothetical protein